MPKGQRITIILLFLLLVFFFIFYGFIIFDPLKKRKDQIVVHQPTNATLSEPVVTFIDPKRGSAHPDITLVEFGDYQCSYCKDMEPTLLSALTAYPNLVVVWKDLPNVSLHREAQNAANAARCAGAQGKYWEYHDLLFKNQADLGSSLYQKLAEQVGVQVGKFNACLANKDHDAIIQRSVEEALALGVDGTPYFFLGNIRLSGQISPAELSATLKVANSQQ